MNNFLIEQFDNRNICISGIGKMFYQDGFPISLAISEMKKKNVEVSFFHIIEEFWNNGWSWKTIEAKLKAEMELDIDKSINVNLEELKYFYNLLEQPKRSNGGYEESRELIFNYLFNNVNVKEWLKSKINLVDNN